MGHLLCQQPLVYIVPRYVFSNVLVFILVHNIVIESNLHPIANKLQFIYFCLGFCFVVGMGHGIKYLHITTDPVQLWASPHSRSRIEREFFDSNFSPFYRVEQVSWEWRIALKNNERM